MLAGPLEAVLGGVDELVVLKCLAGLLVHWAESSFGLRRWGRTEGSRANGCWTRKFQFISLERVMVYRL